MKTHTKTLFQTRVPAAVAKTVRIKAKAAGMTPAAYLRRLLMSEHHVPSPEEIAAQAALAAKLAAEAEARANYRPNPSTCSVLDDGLIAYDSMSAELVPPGGQVHITFGEMKYDDSTGFPGLPDTRFSMFGVREKFKPEVIYVSPSFNVSHFFGGSESLLPRMVGEVPGEAFDVGKPQPNYREVAKGLMLTLSVHNVSGEQRAFRGRIVGREVK